jgi:hypothetical protein
LWSASFLPGSNEKPQTVTEAAVCATPPLKGNTIQYQSTRTSVLSSAGPELPKTIIEHVINDQSNGARTYGVGTSAASPDQASSIIVNGEN